MAGRTQTQRAVRRGYLIFPSPCPPFGPRAHFGPRSPHPHPHTAPPALDVDARAGFGSVSTGHADADADAEGGGDGGRVMLRWIEPHYVDALDVESGRRRGCLGMARDLVCFRISHLDGDGDARVKNGRCQSSWEGVVRIPILPASLGAQSSVLPSLDPSQRHRPSRIRTQTAHSSTKQGAPSPDADADDDGGIVSSPDSILPASQNARSRPAVTSVSGSVLPLLLLQSVHPSVRRGESKNDGATDDVSVQSGLQVRSVRCECIKARIQTAREVGSLGIWGARDIGSGSPGGH
ncbi:hypothetical protein C8R47DRAFT_1210768 [Mycena vitilis]|nr:hypothetical protein C8R47DRAFT_1210768 [Mycena vitilis]